MRSLSLEFLRSIPHLTTEILGSRVQQLINRSNQHTPHFYFDPNYTDEEGNNALHLAVQTGDRAKVILVLQLPLKLNAFNHSGLTPLMEAISRGYADIVNLLVSTEINPFFKDSTGRNAFDLAVKSGDFNIYNLLLMSRHCVLGQSIEEQSEMYLPLGATLEPDIDAECLR